MPGIQLIKFPFFELLSANFTRFASVHFRMLPILPAPWILRQSRKGRSENFSSFLGWKSQRRMINVITSGGGRAIRLGNESTRIDNLAIENAINPRLNLIRKKEVEKRVGPTLKSEKFSRKESSAGTGSSIYEYKLKNIFALSSS